MNAYRVPSVPPIWPKKTSPKTSAAAEPKRKKSYHSVAVPIRLAKTTLPTERLGAAPGEWFGTACVVMVLPFGCRAGGAARVGAAGGAGSAGQAAVQPPSRRNEEPVIEAVPGPQR